MKSIHSNTASEAATQKYTVANSLVSYYLAIMFSFFPLFLTEQYSHARTDKFWFYLILTAVMLLSVGVCMLISRSEAARLGHAAPRFAPLTVTDILMLCFLGFAVLSTLCSAYPDESFTGFAGRDNGLLILLAYTLMYFALTRNYVYKDYVLIGYLLFSMIVAGLTVLNFYNIDPLNIYSGYGADVIEDFGSTIGNKNMIAAFMCLYLPVSVMAFTVTENKRIRLLSGVAIAFAYAGLLCADSTSDILGLIVILPVMLIFSARSLCYLRRYLLALTVLFASGKLLHLFAALTGDNNKGFEFVQEFLIYSPAMFAPIVICAALALTLYLLPDRGRYPAKVLQIFFAALFAAEVIAALALFIRYSVFDTAADLGSFEKLLRFSDAWGTHRGFMWRVSLEEYARFDLFKKLFGSGPDTLYYVFEPHFGELLNRFGDSSTDTAHNEFINYLVTQGALGLMAYLGVVGSVLLRGLRTARRNPTVLIFMSAIICYLAQSAVNLYTPIITPLFFIFISLTEALNRTEAEQ